MLLGRHLVEQLVVEDEREHGRLRARERAVVGAAALPEPATLAVDREGRREHEHRLADPLDTERGRRRLQHAAPARDERRRGALVLGPLEVVVLAQERQQHPHAARMQRSEQREGGGLAADADEGRDRPGPERSGVRGERLARSCRLPRLRAARRARSARRSSALASAVTPQRSSRT